jgi:hypothetical protein
MAIRVSGQPQKHGALLADEIATWLLRFSGNPLNPTHPIHHSPGLISSILAGEKMSNIFST